MLEAIDQSFNAVAFSIQSTIEAGFTLGVLALGNDGCGALATEDAPEVLTVIGFVPDIPGGGVA